MTPQNMEMVSTICTAICSDTHHDSAAKEASLRTAFESLSRIFGENESALIQETVDIFIRSINPTAIPPAVSSVSLPTF